jgi:benzodiazapine receptor
MMNSAAVWALIICGVAAGLEGLAGGKDVKSYLSTLNLPRFSPPFLLWILIGGLYYIICFVVLFRLLQRPDNAAGSAIGIVLLLMVMNILWTYVFFRRRSFAGSTLIAVLYTPVAIGLFILLRGLDSTAAWVFAPYMIYLAFAGWWTLALWRMNRRTSSADH